MSDTIKRLRDMPHTEGEWEVDEIATHPFIRLSSGESFIYMPARESSIRQECPAINSEGDALYITALHNLHGEILDVVEVAFKVCEECVHHLFGEDGEDVMFVCQDCPSKHFRAAYMRLTAKAQEALGDE